jgi:hypothetical protein
MAGVEEMRGEMATMKEFLIKQSREILKLKRLANGGQVEEDEDDFMDCESGQARLNYIEHQAEWRIGFREKWIQNRFRTDSEWIQNRFSMSSEWVLSRFRTDLEWVAKNGFRMEL